MTLKTLASVAALAVATTAGTAQAQSRDQIQIVGSSTVFPFSTAAAERFGQQSGYKTPVVEATGSGGGIKLFCDGVGANTPDITNASRRIKESEVETCTSNGVTPVEVKAGFDGIVLANSKAGEPLQLTRAQLFQALAKDLPDESGAPAPNAHVNFTDIDASLPNEKIEILGPPPTSGTRDAFEELVMEEGCIEAGYDEAFCEESATAIREDGVYVEAGENDNLIVQKLEANPNAYGIFGFSFLDQNADKLRGAAIDGVEPTFENIASGDYPVSRSLYFYIKKEHVGTIPGIKEYAAEFVSDQAAGEDGYLTEKGLIPLDEDELAAQQETVAEMKPISM